MGSDLGSCPAAGVERTGEILSGEAKRSGWGNKSCDKHSDSGSDAGEHEARGGTSGLRTSQTEDRRLTRGCGCTRGGSGTQRDISGDQLPFNIPTDTHTLLPCYFIFCWTPRMFCALPFILCSHVPCSRMSGVREALRSGVAIFQAARSSPRATALSRASSSSRKSTELEPPSPGSATYAPCDLGPVTTSLSSSFLICNLGVVVPTSQGCRED